MASEVAITAIALMGLGFLWYSNEVTKRTGALWGNFFFVLACLFFLADFGVMDIYFQSEGLYDQQDLVSSGLFTVVFYTMFVIVFLWFVNLILTYVQSLQKKGDSERVEKVGSKYGPQ